MRNLFGWDCFLDFYTDVLTYSCKQRGAIAEKHWGIVDGKLVDSSAKILLNNVSTPAILMSLFPATIVPSATTLSTIHHPKNRLSLAEVKR